MADEFWEKIKDSTSQFLRMVYKIETGRSPKEFFECTCGHAVMKVSLDAWDEYTPYVDIMFYGEHETGFVHRLKHAWDIIRYGHPQHAEEITLTLESARKMGIFLLQEADKGEAIRKEMENEQA